MKEVVKPLNRSGLPLEKRPSTHFGYSLHTSDRYILPICSSPNTSVLHEHPAAAVLPTIPLLPGPVSVVVEQGHRSLEKHNFCILNRIVPYYWSVYRVSVTFEGSYSSLHLPDPHKILSLLGHFQICSDTEAPSSACTCQGACRACCFQVREYPGELHKTLPELAGSLQDRKQAP